MLTHSRRSLDSRIASASYDPTIRLWDASTGEELHTLKGHTNVVTSVTFSPDGKRIASASGDGTVKLWDVVTGRETATFTEHTKGVRTVAFSPDALRVVSGGFANTVKGWDARPWPPELKVQYETRGYLTYHTPRFSSDAALQEAIQADQTISDQVRQQALDWSALFWKNYAHKRSGQLFLDSWGIVKQPELGNSLREIAANGADYFYRGPLGEKIADHIQSVGGLLSREDLAGYAPEWQQPIEVDYRGVSVRTCPPNCEGFQIHCS